MYGVNPTTGNPLAGEAAAQATRYAAQAAPDGVSQIAGTASSIAFVTVMASPIGMADVGGALAANWLFGKSEEK